MKAPRPPKQLRPVLKTARASARDGEGALKTAFRRLAEISRLKAMLPAPTPPAKVGKRALTESETNHFALAVEVANRTGDKVQSQAYSKAVADATQGADARFFEIVATAMRAVRASRDEGMSAATMHTILALTAKLELEQEHGELPNTFQVSIRAYEIGCLWFEDQSDRIAGPEEKAAWCKARKAAGLDYLPAATRGKAWQD